MLVFRTGDRGIVDSLAALVQAWIVAERTNHRLVIDWPGLPAERLQLRPFFDYHRNDARGAIEYTPHIHPPENNKHLLQYYYRRIFTQIFLIRHPTLLPYAHKHIIMWREESFPHLETIVRHHWCKTKLVYRFSATDDPVAIPDPPFIAGVVNAKQHEQILPAAENWSTFLHLAACAVIVAPPDPFIDTIVKCFRNKEHWIVQTNKAALTR
jgi:hypothetical protein